MIRSTLEAMKVTRRLQRRARRRSVLACVPLESRTLLSTVTSLLDDGGAGTLRAVIASAPAGDTITFAHSVRGTLTLTQGPITIDKNLEIDGPGASALAISGGGTTSLFAIRPDATSATGPALKVTIDGLTIRDGLAPVYGAAAAISSLQTDLTLRGTVVAFQAASPAAQGGGSAILVSASVDPEATPPQRGPASLTIDHSSFHDNQVAVVSVFDATTSIEASSFLNNQGSAVTTATTYGLTDRVLTVEGTGFVGNVVPAAFYGYGGAIANGGTAVVRDCLFDSDRVQGTASAVGGAIANTGYPSVLTVTDSTFRNNAAQGIGSFGTGSGGAIGTVYRADVSVSGCAFVNNEATAGFFVSQGGAISNIGADFTTPPLGLRIHDSSFRDNTAVGADAESSGPFTGSAVGGAVFEAEGILALSNVSFTHNTARGGSTSTGSPGSATGGAVAMQYGSSFMLDGGTFVNNTAQDGSGPSGFFPAAGGAVAIEYMGLTATASLTDAQFVNNKAVGGSSLASPGFGAPAWGGALELQSAGTVTIDRSSFVGNTAQGGSAAADGFGAGQAAGGAIQLASTSLAVSDSTFLANRALGGDAPGSFAGSAQGGAIAANLYAYTVDVNGVVLQIINTFTLTRSSLLGNRVKGGAGTYGGDAQGGGLWISGSFGGLANLTDSLIAANQATAGPAGQGQGLGGGLYISPGSVVKVNKKMIVIGNQASTADNDISGPVTPI